MNYTTKLFPLTFFVLFFATVFYSCDDLLTEAPESSVSSANVWQEPSDATGALYGAYSQFRSSYGANYHLWGDDRTGFYGEGAAAGSFFKQNLWRNQLTPMDNGTDWGSIYTLINDVNLILKYTPELQFQNENDRNFVLGNAYFLRAFAYYQIARTWGDAPILLEPHESADAENLYPSREPVEQVFNQVGSDIEQSIELIPDNDIRGKGVASKEAAYMLAADYYLWESRVNGNDMLNMANEAVDNVLNSTNFVFSDNYEDVFTDDNNEELILSIIYDSDETERAEGYILQASQIAPSARNNPIPAGSATNWYNITESYKDYLQEKEYDVRAEINAAEHTAILNDGSEVYYWWTEKYKGTLQDGTRIFNSDYRVYRFTEAILFKAEILNELEQTAEAIEYINRIAERAYNEEDYYSLNLSYDEVDNILLDERIKEFSTEGKAWFDLIRFDQAFDRVESLLGREGVQNILLWPVSSNSINTNPNIEQTPGY